MKQKALVVEMGESPGPPVARRRQRPRAAETENAVKAGLSADAALASRCLAGDVAAWEELYAQCHEPLLVSIRVMLGPQSADASLVDEIAARVWYALVAKDGELLARYKPSRGCATDHLYARPSQQRDGVLHAQRISPPQSRIDGAPRKIAVARPGRRAADRCPGRVPRHAHAARPGLL